MCEFLKRISLYYVGQFEFRLAALEVQVVALA